MFSDLYFSHPKMYFLFKRSLTIFNEGSSLMVVITKDRFKISIFTRKTFLKTTVFKKRYFKKIIFKNDRFVFYFFFVVLECQTTFIIKKLISEEDNCYKLLILWLYCRSCQNYSNSNIFQQTSFTQDNIYLSNLKGL